MDRPEQEQPKRDVPYAVRQMNLMRSDMKRLRAIIDAVGECISFKGNIDSMPEMMRLHVEHYKAERDQAMRDAVRLHEAMRLGKCGMVIDDNEVEELALRNSQYRDTLGIE
jgi:hypothetical protein